MKKYSVAIIIFLSIVFLFNCENESNPTEPANQPPTITSLIATPDSLNPGESSTIVCLSNDPDGDSLTYSWSKICGNLSGTGNSIVWTAPNFTGNCIITCLIKDVAGNVDSASVIIKVYNTTPMISEITASPDSVHFLGLINVECITIDPDGDSLTYTWSTSGGIINGSGSIVEWNAPAIAGTYTISCKVNDPQGAKDSSSVEVEVFNNSPIISGLTTSSDSIDFNETINICCQVEDPDGDNISFIWQAEAGSITGTDSIVQWLSPIQSGDYKITCIVTDDFGGADSIYKYINVYNNPPEINNLFVSEDTVKILNEIDIICNAIDMDGDPLTYDWYSSGGTILGSDSIVSWIAPDAVGDFTITCVISDIYGQRDSVDVNIGVYLLPISTQGLVGYWPFIGNANDMSGYSNDGLVMGAQLTHDRNGNPNSAYDFDGIDDYIDIGDPTELQIQGELTLSAWVNYRAIDSFSGIIAKGFMFNGTEAQGAYGLGVSRNTSKVFFEIKTELSNRRICQSNIVITTNIWYHIVATFTPGVGMKLYIDGLIDGQVSLIDTQIIHYTTWPNNDVRFGDNQRSIAQPSNPGELNGYIDEISIFNRALSDQEIQILYNSNW